MNIEKDISIIIIGNKGIISPNLDQNDRDILEKDIEVPQPERRVETEAFQTGEPERTVDDDIAEFYALTSEVTQGLEDALAEIENRAAGLTYFFNPEQQSDLSEYIRDIFDGASGNQITFEMYKKCLDFNEELDKEIGKQQINAELGI